MTETEGKFAIFAQSLSKVHSPPKRAVSCLASSIHSARASRGATTSRRDDTFWVVRWNENEWPRGFYSIPGAYRCKVTKWMDIPAVEVGEP